MIETDLYQSRFSSAELDRARRFWRPICRFLQRYVSVEGATLDLGAGFCHFINQIESGRKIAMDINEDVLQRYAADEVECLTSSGADLSGLPSDSLDTVFASNVYEHFSSREEVARSFSEVRRVLRPGGRFIILQPNFAYCYRQYFDFFDHRLIFTDRGMAEGLRMTGFDLEVEIPRFLPFTSKSRIPQAEWLVWAYLRVPLAWRLLGAQMLLVGRKCGSAGSSPAPCKAPQR